MTGIAPYRELAKAIGAGESTLVARIFEFLVSEEEAKVMLLAAPPATAQELAQKSSLA